MYKIKWGEILIYIFLLLENTQKAPRVSSFLIGPNWDHIDVACCAGLRDHQTPNTTHLASHTPFVSLHSFSSPFSLTIISPHHHSSLFVFSPSLLTIFRHFCYPRRRSSHASLAEQIYIWLGFWFICKLI